MKRRKSATRAPTSSDLLFEIGTEELPAAYLPDLIAQLRGEAETLLTESHLRWKRVESFGTPRRLVLVVRGLEGTQRNPAEEIRGPSKEAAFDARGKPTKALSGFLRARGGTLKQIKIVSSARGARAAGARGDYIYLVKPPTRVPTTKVLPALLPQLITRLHAPKTMRWDDAGARFARPIRWLLALYGRTSIRVRYGRLASQTRTWVGGPLRPNGMTVSSLAAFHQTLKRAGIVLDQQQRRAAIERMVRRLAAHVRGKPVAEMVSHGLLDEVAYLVERPVALRGTFDPTYLELPREVLLASMAKYQRVFALESTGKLLPSFIAILEGTPRRASQVRHVFEHILNARLADSLLFWRRDHEQLPLERMGRALTGVTFHERLGSMAEKADRLYKLAGVLEPAWELTKEEFTNVRRACQLAKADLVSTMVKEFPSLQGVIGKYYATDSGEAPAVSQAIEEHYLPAADRSPATLTGSALAFLDRYDTLTGYFGVGIEPTGDQDPFGLRRAAQGIVELAWLVRMLRPVRLPLDELLRSRGSMPPFISAPPDQVAKVGQRVRQYVFERLYTFPWPTPAPSVDCIDAVLASAGEDLVDILDRIVSLHALTGDHGLLKAAKVVERTKNILKGAPRRQTQVHPDHLQDPLEQRLWELYRTHHERVSELVREKSYGDATRMFGDLFFEPLHAFFDGVLVNVPDEALQQNRLALMRAINALYTERIADLSKLRILQREESS